MTKSWSHKHILTLADLSKDEYETILRVAEKLNSLNKAQTKGVFKLEGKLITSIFFEPSTRTRNSFELAAKKLSADVLSFSPISSSISKGESDIDTAITYAAMGSDVLIIRHSSSNLPLEISKKLDSQKYTTSVLNAGDGLHSHPSQGLVDLYTLSQFFSKDKLDPENLCSKKILILGDVLHSRVARSDIWALTAFGADVVLCGPENLVPDEFKNFIINNRKLNKNDPVKKRGTLSISRSLDLSIKEAEAVIVLRLQKERMKENLLNNLKSYSEDYCLTLKKLKLNKNNIPVLHPGPINRGVEICEKVVDEYQNCLITKQVSNGIPLRMSLLYLLTSFNKQSK